MRIVIIIPAFNEEASIGDVIRSIPRQFPSSDDVKIIVVDDGSSDETRAVAREAGANYIVRHKINLGIANAFKSGIRAAQKIGADIIVNIDADGQFDAQEITQLIAPIANGQADVVLGTRFKSKQTAQIVPIAKRIGNQLVTSVVSAMSGKKFTDTQCGFRAISRKASEEMDVLGLFTYTQEMILDLIKKGFRICEVPITVRYFTKRSSRVVSSLPKYASKAIGLILLTSLRLHQRSILIVLILHVILIGFGFLLSTVLY